MAVLEELPAEASSSKQATAAKPDKDVNQLMKTFDSVPLFMTSLPEDGDEGDQTALEALQSLTFDGTPDEVAANFKKQGNDYFLGKRYKEARDFYRQGLDAHPRDTALLETLHLNRAACELELSNFRQAARDCSAVLEINPKSTKAFYRAARALHGLDRNVEAIDCCDHALAVDAENTAVKKLKAQIIEKGLQVEKRKKEQEEWQRRKEQTKVALNRAFLARGIWIETSSRPPDNPSEAHFDPEASASSASLPLVLPEGDTRKWMAPDPIRTPVIFPVFFIYPQYAQSDLIEKFHEDTAIGDHLDAMFPQAGAVGWDERGEYVGPKLSAYTSTKQRRLLKLGRKLTLREVLDQGAKDADPKKGEQRDGVVLRDGLLSIIVLPSKSEAEKRWVEQFKKEREEAASKTAR